MGGETTPSRAVVQSAGYGYRLRASVLQTEFGQGGDLQHLLLRYTQALITQMSLPACAGKHFCAVSSFHVDLVPRCYQVLGR